MVALRDLAVGYCGLMAFLLGVSALLCFARWGNEHKWRIISAALAIWAMMFAGAIYIRASHNEAIRAFFNQPWKEVCYAAFAIYFWVPIFAIKVMKEVLTEHVGKMAWAYFAAWFIWVILVVGIIYIRAYHNEVFIAFFNEPWKKVCCALFVVYFFIPLTLINVIKEGKNIKEDFGVDSS